MNIEAEYTLSFYKDVTSLDKNNKAMLVQHINSGELFVKKQLPLYCKNVYSQFKETNIAGIPRVIECIYDDDALYVVEEYIHGRTLMQYFEENGPIPESVAIIFILSLCNILNNIHDMTPPVIHRDIKPSNLILTNDGMLKLIDFDSAKNISTTESKDTHLLGTENFAAPEQYGFGSSDKRTDIYGLGSTINFLLTGKYPNEEIYNGALGDVLRKCLELDSSNRFQDAATLYDAVENLKKVSNKKRPSKMHNEPIPTEFEKIILGDVRRKVIGNRCFLPVGFRSYSLPRIIIGIFYYLISIYLSFDFEEGYILDDLSWFMIFLFTIAWFGNYAGIRNFVSKSVTNIIFATFINILLWLIVVGTFLLS